MHDIEPYYGWREKYTAEDDKESPFFRKEYNEFSFTNKIYNYFIHPQWDEFGSDTLYLKILFIDYIEGYAILEFIGEWNDCITNDIMHLKRNIIDLLMKRGISRFAIILENVLNFHGDDDSYYEEWYEDVSDEQGWICGINMLDHVLTEMVSTGIQYYLNIGGRLNDITWRSKEPNHLIQEIENIMNNSVKQLRY
jgi:hypothetical protein